MDSNRISNFSPDEQRVQSLHNEPWQRSTYNRDLVLVLCCIGFFGFAGIHRLYVGKIWSGILWFLTGGLFGIGTVYDLLCICKGWFEDSDDRRIVA